MKHLIAFSLASFSLLAGELQVDPAGTFSISIPGALLPCTLSAGQLACPSGNSSLTITVRTVQENASLALMALNAEDTMRNKPQYKMLKQETVTIDGYKAIFQTMTFNNLSNVMLPVMVRTIDAIAGTKAVELQVACNQSTCSKLIGAFDEAIETLHLAKPGQKLRSSSESSGMDLQNWLNGFKF